MLDLHGMNLDNAWTAIDRALEQAIARGDRVVLLITGHHRPGDPPVMRREERVEQRVVRAHGFALRDGAAPNEAAALAAQDVEDEHRRALCTELARRAIEEALA